MIFKEFQGEVVRYRCLWSARSQYQLSASIFDNQGPRLSSRVLSCGFVCTGFLERLQLISGSSSLQPEPSVGYEPSYITNSHVDRLQSDQLLSVYWSSQQQLKESCWYSFSKLLPKATQRTTCVHQQRQRTKNFLFKARFSLAKSLSILNVAQPQTFEHYLLMLLITVFTHSIKYYPICFFLFLLI